MQALARVADAVGEHGFNVHVDVLVIQGELHAVAVDLRQNLAQARDDFFCLVFLDNALLPQHGRVGNGALDVLPVKPGVEVDGGVELIYQGIGLFLKPSGPKLHIVIAP